MDAGAVTDTEHMNEPHLILGIGELLWDILPDGMRLGGAPANFAVMAGRLGNHAAILSRIGRDELGRQAIDRLDPMPVETSFLEVDAAHETGRVTVSFCRWRAALHHPPARSVGLFRTFRRVGSTRRASRRPLLWFAGAAQS